MQLLLLLAWLVVCAEQDARQRQISNWLTFGGFAIFLLFLLTMGRTWIGASAADGGCALVLALMFTLPGHVLGRLGAGDVKLLAALALASDSLHILGTFIGAGDTSLIWLLIRQKTWPYMGQWFSERYSKLGSEGLDKQPFAPFLLAGFVLTISWLH